MICNLPGVVVGPVKDGKQSEEQERGYLSILVGADLLDVDGNGADLEVDGLTSFWELFCLSKMEGRPPQMRAMSRVLVLGSTILSSVFRESK